MTDDSTSATRAFIEEQTRGFAGQDTGTMLSLGNMERLLGQEYYGRFGIEVVQNTRDA